jgi:hypothetical protein
MAVGGSCDDVVFVVRAVDPSLYGLYRVWNGRVTADDDEDDGEW